MSKQSTPLEKRPRLELSQEVPSVFESKTEGVKGVSEVRFFIGTMSEMSNKNPNGSKDPNIALDNLTNYLRKGASTRLRNKNQVEELESFGSLEEPMMVKPPLVPEVLSNTIQGRGLLASCWRGRCRSVTVRKQEDTSNPGVRGYAPDFAGALEKLQSQSDCKFKPSDEAGSNFFFPLPLYCRTLYEEIKGPKKGPPEPGVYVIAGGTSSGKSTIIRGLIYHFLTARLDSLKSDDVRPHLVTVENPIEAFLFGENVDSAKIQEEYAIDYTPRQIPQDTPTLHQALMQDALRQTPFLMYVGEVRTPKEIETVLDFAETGHTVITTLHAGSVREGLERLLGAAHARTPALQGQIARRIRALIHLDTLPTRHERKRVAVPAVWRGTSSGVAALVADGLSSVLPDRADANSHSRGRAYFLECFWKAAQEERADNKTEPLPDALLKEAIKKDMQF